MEKIEIEMEEKDHKLKRKTRRKEKIKNKLKIKGGFNFAENERKNEAYAKIIADGIELSVGFLAEPVRTHLVQYLIHNPDLNLSLSLPL